MDDPACDAEPCSCLRHARGLLIVVVLELQLCASSWPISYLKFMAFGSVPSQFRLANTKHMECQSPRISRSQYLRVADGHFFSGGVHILTVGGNRLTGSRIHVTSTAIWIRLLDMITSETYSSPAMNWRSGRSDSGIWIAEQ